MAYFLAEIGSNHNQDIERTLALIDKAADLGFQGVKFQLFEVDKLYAPEVRDAHAAYKCRELPRSFVPLIAERCRERGVEFVCTPFHSEDVAFLAQHVDRFKVSSFDILRLGFIMLMAETGKPIILSTGMAFTSEIRDAVMVAGLGTWVLHCVSGYPVAAKDCDLSRIQWLRAQTRGGLVGWSDHSASIPVVKRAIEKWNAGAVELHFDLDGEGYEFVHGHCWLPCRVQRLFDELAFDRSMDESTSVVGDRDQRADTDGMRPMRGVR